MLMLSPFRCVKQFRLSFRSVSIWLNNVYRISLSVSIEFSCINFPFEATQRVLLFYAKKNEDGKLNCTTFCVLWNKDDRTAAVVPVNHRQTRHTHTVQLLTPSQDLLRHVQDLLGCFRFCLALCEKALTIFSYSCRFPFPKRDDSNSLHFSPVPGKLKLTLSNFRFYKFVKKLIILNNRVTTAPQQRNNGNSQEARNTTNTGGEMEFLGGRAQQSYFFPLGTPSRSAVHTIGYRKLLGKLATSPPRLLRKWVEQQLYRGTHPESWLTQERSELVRSVGAGAI